MDETKVFLQRVEGRFGDVAFRMTRASFSTRQSGSWSPPINAYHCNDQFCICVELAGLPLSEIDVAIEPRQVVIRGNRPAPQPDECTGPPSMVLALEIDEGPFERQILLPIEVDPGSSRIEQRNGWLWIQLPFRSRG